MKRTFRFFLDIGYVGARKEETRTLEFDDDATPEEIEAEVSQCLEEWKDQEVSYWHEEMPEEEVARKRARRLR